MIPVAIGVWFCCTGRHGVCVCAPRGSQTVAFAAGLKPQRMQYQALFAAGILGGVGGGHLLDRLHENVAGGHDGGRRVHRRRSRHLCGVVPDSRHFGAVLFGGAVALQLQLQARGTNVSPFLLDMIPYLLVLVVLMLFGRVRGRVVPAGLKRYF